MRKNDAFVAKIVNMGLTKILMTILAPDERLPSSATLTRRDILIHIFIDFLTISVRSIIPPQTPGDLLRLLSTLLLGQVGSPLTFFILNQIKSKRNRTSRFRHPGMAVLNGKPTVMGGYEKGATPRDQDRVTFGIKGSRIKDGPG